jgi:bifunctional DNA-binding transcriptional regulator/antitoxin component of YhaV-PrlF toxin-antitoxin module
MKKIVKLRKAGNSLIITIPKELADDLKWRENDQILLDSEEQKPETYFRGPKILKVGKID